MAIENFLSYTESDLSGQLSVTSNICTFAGLTRNADTWIVKDKSVNHFSGDYENLITLEITAMGAGGFVSAGALTNVINDYKWMLDNGGDSHTLIVNNANLGLVEINNGSQIIDDFVSAINTPYYITMTRDETIGVNGRLTAKIYDDHLRTNLVDILLINLRDRVDFQYIMGVQSYNSASSQIVSGSVENLDLQEVAAFQAAWARNSNQIIGMPQ